MNYEVLCGQSAAVLKLTMDAGESITTEGGAMLSMSSGLRVETTTRSKKNKGGVLKSIKRMLGGENFFLNHYSSSSPGSELMLAPVLSGDLIAVEMDQSEDLIVQAGSWLASTEGVGLDTQFAGLGKALFSGEGMFWLKLSGNGSAFINSFGAIYCKEVDGDYIVDTGHIVAYTSGLDFKATKAGGSWATAIFGGEGLVCRFSGRGRVWIQSHNPGSFGGTLGPNLKPR